ncbi:GIY-YIG nuclease family protein [Microbulbifer echini]|uniref:GIY-YIG nuclease family protein n=1 Tax=Microbulbifer echini TaxID=1529067 RepID=A0ABV4NKE2_9GAMM|nr:GIY-YIG nuclease family protein [uncultured Microbulbifer sp.]
MNTWFVYLIRTANGSLYTGITRDIQRRFAEHSTGGPKAAKALRGKGPLTLEYQAQTQNKSTALKLEIAIKKWPKQKKEALIAGTQALPQLPS